MKTVLLERTTMLNDVPKGPNDGLQLVTNRVARHLVSNGDVLEENVTDADGADPDDGDLDDVPVEQKALDRAVKAKLRELRAEGEKAIKAKEEALDKALAAEIERFREEGDARLATALAEQEAAQTEVFAARVAAAVEAAKTEGAGA
jgi:hypothetical protein